MIVVSEGLLPKVRKNTHKMKESDARPKRSKRGLHRSLQLDDSISRWFNLQGGLEGKGSKKWTRKKSYQALTFDFAQSEFGGSGRQQFTVTLAPAFPNATATAVPIPRLPQSQGRFDSSGLSCRSLYAAGGNGSLGTENWQAGTVGSVLDLLHGARR